MTEIRGGKASTYCLHRDLQVCRVTFVICTLLRILMIVGNMFVRRCSPKLTVVSCLMPLAFQLTLRSAARLFLVLYDSLDTYSRALMIWELHSVLLCGCQMVATFSGHNTRRPGSKLVDSADVRDFRNWKVFILSCTSRSVWFVQVEVEA